jgi:hypothetical protein
VNAGDRAPILDLLVRQIVKRPRNEQAELDERIDRLATGEILLVRIRCQHHGLDLGAILLPPHQQGDRLQRVALLAACPHRGNCVVLSFVRQILWQSQNLICGALGSEQNTFIIRYCSANPAASSAKKSVTAINQPGSHGRSV